MTYKQAVAAIARREVKTQPAVRTPNAGAGPGIAAVVVMLGGVALLSKGGYIKKGR